MSLNLRVVGNVGDDVFFRVNLTTLFRKLVRAYSSKIGVSMERIQLFHNGQPIRLDQTPRDLDVRDEDDLLAVIDHAPAKVEVPKKAIVEEKKLCEGAEEVAAHAHHQPRSLADSLGSLVGQPKFADVYFLVGDERIPAHRLLLAASSPLFETMLRPSGDAAGSSGMLEVHIKDTSPATFRALLRCIYTDQVEVTNDNLQQLIRVANKYQVPKLHYACWSFMERSLNTANCCHIFNQAPDLLGDPEFGLRFIRENAELVVETPSFRELTLERLKFLLEEDQLAVDEVPLFQAVVLWGKEECKRQGLDAEETSVLASVLEEVLVLCRLPTLELGELVLHVLPTGLLSEHDMLELCTYVSQPRGQEKPCTLKYNCTPRQGGSVAKNSKLIERKHKKEILRLFDLKINSPKKLSLELLYRGSRDGFTAGAFHSSCDNKPGTITFIRPINSTNIFGGYFAGSWSTNGSYCSANSWIFSLENQRGTPLKFVPHSGSNNAYNNASYGPTWGGGHDLHINNNMRSSMSYTNPSSYQRLAPGYSGSFTKDLFAGSYKFAVDEIETFLVHIK